MAKQKNQDPGAPIDSEQTDLNTSPRTKRPMRVSKNSDAPHSEEREVIETPAKRATRSHKQTETSHIEEHEVLERPVRRSSRTSKQVDASDSEEHEVIERPVRRTSRSKKQVDEPASEEHEVLERPVRRTSRPQKQADVLADDSNNSTIASNANLSDSDSKGIDALAGESPADGEISDAQITADPSESKESVYHLTTLKLKRPAGRLQSRSQSSSPTSQPVIASSDPGESIPKPFVPKSLPVVFSLEDTPSEATPSELSSEAPLSPLRKSNIFLPIPEERFAIHFPSPVVVRRESITQRQHLLDAHNGSVSAHPNNRALGLRDVQVPANRLRGEITADDYRSFVERLRNSALQNGIHACLNHVVRWSGLIGWFGDIPDSVRPNTAQPVSVDANVTDDSQKEDESQEETDPAVDALFEMFRIGIEPFHADFTRENDIYDAHLSVHSERITTLLCDWARALTYIDQGISEPKTGTPLIRCFLERFQEYLRIDGEAAKAQNVILPDMLLQSRFNLDNIDLLILWFLAALEIDPRLKQALMSTWNLNTQVYMSAGVLMRLFAMGARQRNDILARVSPSSPMEFLGLFKIVQNAAPTSPLYYEIVVSEQVIHMFTGTPSLSLLSRQYAEIQFPSLSPDTYISPENEKTFDIVKNYFERPPINAIDNLGRNNLDYVPSLGFLVEGLPGTGRCTMIKIIATRLHRPIIIVQGSPLPAMHPSDLELYLKSLFVDAMLMNAILCFRDTGAIFADERVSGYLAKQLALRSVVCALCVDLAVKVPPVMEPYVTFKTKMTANLKDKADSYWRAHLALPMISNRGVNVRALSEQLALQPFQIQKATKLAYYATDSNPSQLVTINNEMLRKAASVQVQKNIGSLAFVSDPEITLDDVIVSDDIMEKIKQIVGSAINRRRVLYEWGLSRRIRRGTGIIALFDGEPGTGKTHSAEAIAKSIGLSLMRVNIATMVDKYIGETEKNLTTIFEQARPDMQLLLFDEADSLFAKRTSNVSKSNDRYANMSVNVLLQLIERYEGVSILTTNLKNALDPAFERRITYKIYFPMPKQPERERLWKYMCPPDILTSEPIDYEWLSEIEMSGGEIKNAVLTAAFNAATMGVLLNSEILYNAGVAEASSAGRVLRRYEEGQNDFI